MGRERALSLSPAGGLRPAFVVLAALAAALLAGALRGWPAAALPVLAAAVAWCLVSVITPRLRRLELMAQPGGRSIHDVPTPVMGGLAIYLPVAGALAWWAFLGHAKALGLLCGLTLITAVGLVDDLRRVRPRHKLMAQFLAVGLLYFFGWRLPALSLDPYGWMHVGYWQPLVMALWIVGVTNALNLVDGIDGLAGCMALVALVGLAATGTHVLVGSVAIGALLGFLRHNLPPAKIFLGDTGSLMLGFLAATRALDLPYAGNAALALCLFAYPIGDVAVSVARRWLRGKPLFAPDKSHVHHKLLLLLGTGRRTLIFLVGFSVLIASFALWRPSAWAVGVCALAWISLTTVLVVAGRVRPASMLQNRLFFRRAHLVRDYVVGSIGLAQSAGQVNDAVEHLGRSLALTSIRMGTLRHEYGPQEVLGLVEVAVPLRSGRAVWGHVPGDGEPALWNELHAVVTDVLRTADRRLAEIALAATQAAPASPNAALVRAEQDAVRA